MPQRFSGRGTESSGRPSLASCTPCSHKAPWSSLRHCSRAETTLGLLGASLRASTSALNLDKDELWLPAHPPVSLLDYVLPLQKSPNSLLGASAVLVDRKDGQRTVKLCRAVIILTHLPFKHSKASLMPIWQRNLHLKNIVQNYSIHRKILVWYRISDNLMGKFMSSPHADTHRSSHLY